MGSAVLECGRSDDIQDMCFQGAKRSDMDCEEQQECLFADSQEWGFQAAERSDKSSTLQQEDRFAHTVE